LLVSGRVQGVGFRAFVVRAAREVGLTGYTRNQPDGSVEIWAEGTVAALDHLESAVRRGPVHAHVAAVDKASGAATGEYRGFEVRW
jgi:acylphosphatase